MDNKVAELVNIPKTKRGQKTLDSILLAADRLFYEKNYHDTSIIDIAQSANIAPGTFYIYFKDKLSLYRYLLLKYSKDIRSAINIATEGIKNRQKKEREGIKAFLVYVRNKPCAYNIIWNSLYIDQSLFYDYYEDFSKRYASALSVAQKNNEIAQGNVDIFSYILIGIVNFVGLKYSIFEKVENFDEIVDTIMYVLNNGIFVK